MSLSKIIRILPVDDRPCHNDHIVLAMSKVDGVTIELPDPKILGHFTHSGHVDLMSDFLMNDIESVDTLIVSLDALTYGGLIQGRTHSNQPLDLYLERLKVLQEIKSRNPKLKLYAYSVIMRLTTTVTDTSKLSEWEDLFEYSQLVNKVKTHPNLQGDLDQVLNRLSQDTLENYLDTRKRNHSINQRMVELINNGVVDYGVLVQEDTSEFGLHLEEQESLNKLVKELNLTDKVVMKNGTDEMVALFVAKAIVKESKIKLQRDLLKDDFIAPYEDHYFIDNLKKSLAIAEVQIDEEANDILCVIPSLDRTYDLAFEDVSDLNLLSNINYKLKYDPIIQGLHVLDIAYANGGDIRNLEYLISNYEVSKLKSYSAWNTASNATGSLVLDIIIAQDYELNGDYLKMRIIDDALYQGKVRSHLNTLLKEQGQDIWSEVYSEEANTWLTEKLNNLSNKCDLTKGIQIEASLPWGRTFELRLEKI